MRLAKTGQIGNVCQANALMTLKEYLIDYAGDETRAKGEAVIAAEMAHIPNPKVKNLALEYLEQLEDGKRDFRF